MLEGDRSDHALILIRTGRLKIVHTDEDGRELVMAVRGPGELVGEVDALAGADGPRRRVSRGARRRPRAVDSAPTSSSASSPPARTSASR